MGGVLSHSAPIWLGGLSIGWKTAAENVARIGGRRLLAENPARVLPCLARVVPVETQLSQNRCDFLRLLLFELNPNPLANDFGKFIKSRCFPLQKREHLVCRQRPILSTHVEIKRNEFVFA